MITEIQHWFSQSLNYDEGVMLLRSIDPKNRFLGLLMKGKSPYNQGKLEGQLRDLKYKVPKETKPSAKAPAPHYSALPILPSMIKAAPIPSRPKTNALYPAEIQQVIIERGKKVNARDRLSNSLMDILDQSSRADAYAEIKALQEEIAGLSDLIGQYERTGEVNEPPAPKQAKPKAVAQNAPISLEKQKKNAMANRAKKTRKIKEWEGKRGTEDEYLVNNRLMQYKVEWEEWDREVKRLIELCNAEKAGE